MQSFLIFWFLFWSVVAVYLTVKDKRAAGRRQRRVPERTLLRIAALGGSVAMYVTMLLVHHKTRKVKFAVGIPFLIFAQIALAMCLRYYLV